MYFEVTQLMGTVKILSCAKQDSTRGYLQIS
jgi:hypothetical protein